MMIIFFFCVFNVQLFESSHFVSFILKLLRAISNSIPAQNAVLDMSGQSLGPVESGPLAKPIHITRTGKTRSNHKMSTEVLSERQTGVEGTGCRSERNPGIKLELIKIKINKNYTSFLCFSG